MLLKSVVVILKARVSIFLQVLPKEDSNISVFAGLGIEICGKLKIAIIFQQDLSALI
jgi:hypothetical protein